MNLNAHGHLNFGWIGGVEVGNSAAINKSKIEKEKKKEKNKTFLTEKVL